MKTVSCDKPATLLASRVFSTFLRASTMPISLADAKRLNLTRYDSPRPCKRGHQTQRYVSTGACVDCLVLGMRRPVPKVAKKRFVPAFDWGFVVLALRLHPADAQGVVDTAVALSKRRQPRASEYYVCRRTGGEDPQGGMRLYRLEVDPADVAVLRQIEAALIAARVAPTLAMDALRNGRGPSPGLR